MLYPRNKSAFATITKIILDWTIWNYNFVGKNYFFVPDWRQNHSEFKLSFKKTQLLDFKILLQKPQYNASSFFIHNDNKIKIKPVDFLYNSHLFNVFHFILVGWSQSTSSLKS